MSVLNLKITFSNKDVVKTRFNGEPKDAFDYYIYGQPFNLGNADKDRMAYGCDLEIDGIKYDLNTHRYLSEFQHEGNKNLLAARIAGRAKLKGPQVGDFLIDKKGNYLRLTHAWLDEAEFQTTPISGGNAENNGGFYINRDGTSSYSGSLDPSIKITDFELTEEMKQARFWFFSNESARGHNGVYVYVPCKVYKMK